MKKKPEIIIAIALLIATLTGCLSEETTAENNIKQDQSSTEVLVTDITVNEENVSPDQVIITSQDDMFSNRDLELTYDAREIIEINLNNETVSITEEGVYLLSGSIENGQVIVDVGEEEKVQLIFDNVSITSSESAPIYVANADKVFITTPSDTQNFLTISSDISENVDGINGVIYATSDLTLNGQGSLTIKSDYTHGIVCKDDLAIVSNNLSITSHKDGINANDSVRMIDSTLTIVSGQDGIQVKNDENEEKGFLYFENNDIYVESAEDGINASNYIYIAGGTLNITTGGGFQEVLNIITMGEGSGGVVSETDKLTTSMKGIKAYDITVDSGQITISSYEDAFHADNNLTINGGEIIVNSGDEALTAQNTLWITGGTVDIQNGYEGLEGGFITIDGGVIRINVLDDGVNANEDYSVLTINGGELFISCQGDGLDSNGSIIINDGTIVLDVNAIYAGGDGNIDATGGVQYNGGSVVDATGTAIDPTAVFHKGGRAGGGRN